MCYNATVCDVLRLTYKLCTKKAGARVSYLSLTDNHGPSSVLNEIELACLIVLCPVTAITDYGTSWLLLTAYNMDFARCSYPITYGLIKHLL